MFQKIRNLLFHNITTRQTIIKNTFLLFSAEGIGKILRFFVNILIARYLGAAGFGIFSFAFAFIALFEVMADFGFLSLAVREIARNRGLANVF